MPKVERKKIVVSFRKKKQPPSSSASFHRSVAVGAATRSYEAASVTVTTTTAVDASSAEETQQQAPPLNEKGQESKPFAGPPALNRDATALDETGTRHGNSQARGQGIEQQPKRRQRRTHGLPSFTSQARQSSQHLHTKDNDVNAENDFDSFEMNAGEDMPCETMMVLTSLLHDPARRVAIPILESGGHNVYGVSPCHLYAALDDRDPIVLNELRHLLQSNAVCKLRLEPHVVAASATATAAPVRVESDPHHHLLLLKSDYCRAARQSVLRELDPSASSSDIEASQTRQIVEWFLDESSVVDTISEQEVEAKLRNHESRSLQNASLVLSKLQSLQLLRSLPTIHSRTNFQLWLPSWGLVVRAWQKSTTQLLAHLKRSHYKERSYQSLVSRNGPIPGELVVEHLVSQGRVVKVPRPTGTFVQLVA
jgi:Serine-threonine protein kinase 19